jgi:mono/diheme cytochrome c family protein
MDFMPFHNLSDEDLTAVISFLRSQQPVKNLIPDNNYNFLGKAVRAFLIKPVGPDGEVAKSVKRDTTAEYGNYLTHYITNCRGCHTNRNMMTGAYTGPDFAGGLKFESSTEKGAYTMSPNLTPDAETGRITNWTQEQFINRFRQPRIIAISDMPWDQFRTMTDDDLKAIYKYLKGLAPIKNKIQATYVSAASTKK